MSKNKTEALKLPDPLLVRLFRNGQLDQVKKVATDRDRNVTVTMADGAVIHFMHLTDVGWVLESGTCPEG